MINLCRVGVLSAVAVVASGCSSIHNAIGPDKPTSELRTTIEAPYTVAEEVSPFCQKPTLEQIPPVVAVASEDAEFPFGARLFFLLDKADFTPESALEAGSVYDEILALNPQEVVLVGHTDTAASAAYNDALSLRRVDRVKYDLIQRGVPAAIIRASAAGENRPLISTPDETVEVRNRRVEIFAR
jgi:OOP family OmpA-OmpF porin